MPLFCLSPPPKKIVLVDFISFIKKRGKGGEGGLRTFLEPIIPSPNITSVYITYLPIYLPLTPTTLHFFIFFFRGISDRWVLRNYSQFPQGKGDPLFFFFFLKEKRGKGLKEGGW